MRFLLAPPSDLPIFVKKMIRLTFITFLIIGHLSCSSKKPNPDRSTITFFSLADFIKEEQAWLKKEGIILIKILTLNEKRDTIKLYQPDFERELDLFLKADINKPALSDKYSIDSVFHHGNLFKVLYTSKDKKVYTQRLSIQYNTRGKVAVVDIRLYNGSPLTVNVQHLVFRPTKGYQISDNQYFMGKKEAIKVVGLFKQKRS
jgi:hypothetical protein